MQIWILLKVLQVIIRLGNPNPSTLAASYGLDIDLDNKFDSNSINSTVATYKSLKCWYTNAGSLSSKFCELKFRLTVDKPDIVAFSEVNCKIGCNKVEFTIDGYKTIQNTTYQRGVCIFVESDLHSYKDDILNSSSFRIHMVSNFLNQQRLSTVWRSVSFS